MRSRGSDSMEIFPLRVEKKNAHRIESENLRDLPYHFVQDRLDLQRPAGGGSHVMQRREIAVARLAFFEKPGVFDSDHRLVGKGFKQFDLSTREGTNLQTANQNGADRQCFAEQRNSEGGSMSDNMLIILDHRKLAIDHGGKVADMNHLPIDHCSARGRLTIVGRMFERNRKVTVRSDTPDTIVFQAKNLGIFCIAQTSGTFR